MVLRHRVFHLLFCERYNTSSSSLSILLNRHCVAGAKHFHSTTKMSQVEEDRKRFLAMPLEEKRQFYKRERFTTLDQIATWEEFFEQSKSKLQKHLAEKYKTSNPPEVVFKVDSELNKKVSIWKGNITLLEIDTIVNAANKRLLGGGGVDGAIHKAAGPKLLNECKTLNGCKTGESKITAGYELPARYIIHTVGPQGEYPDQLESCYKTCLDLLVKEKLRSIAFPCISTGVYGYPQEAAANIALRTVRNYLEKSPSLIDRVVFCLFLPEDVTIYENLLQIYFPVEENKPNL